MSKNSNMVYSFICNHCSCKVYVELENGKGKEMAPTYCPNCSETALEPAEPAAKAHEPDPDCPNCKGTGVIDEYTGMMEGIHPVYEPTPCQCTYL